MTQAIACVEGGQTGNGMTIDEILRQLADGATLEGPHWTEPVKVLAVKARGTRIEVQAVGLHTKRLWNKLLRAEDFDGAIQITPAGELAALTGNPAHFRLAAEAHRIRLAFQYDPHFAVSVSQVDPLPHQMDAVYSHLLTQPQIRFLIADDPGAGKTIMAGLTLKELKFRGLVERTLIVTPANLTDQWRRELQDKFGETFTVINRGTVGAAYGRNVWEDNAQCITSIDFVARQDDILNLLRDVRWDIVIVDEAHKMAAYRYGQKVTKTQRYEFGGLTSSMAAIRLSLERRRKRLGDLQKLGKIKQEYGEIPEDMDDLTEAERWQFEDDLVERLTMAGTMAELESEIEDLERLVKLAKANEKSVPETKFEELRRVISAHLSGRDERLLVFTEHKDTLDFLIRKLTNLGFYCCTIHGEMPLEKRIDAERVFFEHQRSIMVATEAAGEGINLQFCSLMVNYDIPWNPNRLEQRMGRVHRYGQKHEVMIFNLVAKNTREGEVMECLLRKLDDMRRALGSDRVYDVIGEIIPAPKFDALMKDWLSKRRSMAEIIAEINLQTDEAQVARIRADMEDRSLGSRYIDLSKLDADRQKSKEQRLMPEYIEKFFVEAYRSFGGTITRMKDEGGRMKEERSADSSLIPHPSSFWSITRVPPDLRKLPDALERRFGKIGQTYAKITFDKEQSQGYSEVEFIGPGHPLFEGVVERVLREYASSLRQGTIFYNAETTEPTVLWLLKCAVEDGRGQTIGERLVAVHGRMKGAYRSMKNDHAGLTPVTNVETASFIPHPSSFLLSKCQPYALLDLKAPDNTAEVPAPVRQTASNEDMVIDWSLAEVTPEYFAEINQRRSRALGIKEKYVRKSLQYLIGESIRKIAKYDQQLRQIRDENDPKRLSIQGNRAQEEARKADLSQRLKDRLAEIEQESHLSEKPPEVVGVAVILPPPREVVASVEGMESDPEVEAIAIEFVKKYEVQHGRKPVSVEEENCGWDITSLLEGQTDRYIEVKGRGRVGGVALTPNEWIKAQRFGKDYWLYVVVNCKTKPELYRVQDPASKLSPKEEVSVVRYMVAQKDWSQAATKNSP